MAPPGCANNNKVIDNKVIDPDTEQATTLVIGDSIVRNIRLRWVLTLSFPGATVVDVTEKIVLPFWTLNAR